MSPFKFYHAAAICFVILFVMACKTFYKTKTINTGSSSTLAAKNVDSLQKTNRYFILRNGDNAYYIKNIQLSADQKTANCVLDSLSVYNRLHLAWPANRFQYKPKDAFSNGVINEVHFYIEEDKTAQLGNYTLSLDKVKKIEILEHDKKRTTNSHVAGTVGTVVGVAAVVGLIILATKSSCPFVAAYDGTGFSLQGEIYGGAIYPQLNRYDYLPLKMAPTTEGTLQLKITNELKERQYTDLARLWKISHSARTKVYVDEKGNLLSVVNPQMPVSATLNEKRNVVAALKKQNDYHLVSMEDSSRSDARNEVVMKFKKPANAGKGKLILSLKNSYFLDLLYGELAKGFGSFYATYIKQQKTKTAEELLKWVKEQQIPLDISVNTNTGWRNITSLTTVGPLAFRETAIAIDLSDINTHEVEIKLGCGFMFWELDYAAMDFSEDKNFSVEKLNPVTAIDETGKNVLAELSKEDGIYLDQPSIGNSATITYRSNVAPRNGVEFSYVLESKGYYEHLRDFTNPPDIKFLEQFRKPNAFPLFGIKVYKKVKDESYALMQSSN
jgi:hypothetical protein